MERVEHTPDHANESVKELWDYVNYMLNRYGDGVMGNHQFQRAIDELSKRGEID